jgi:hypothetical protein
MGGGDLSIHNEIVFCKYNAWNEYNSLFMDGKLNIEALQLILSHIHVLNFIMCHVC